MKIIVDANNFNYEDMSNICVVSDVQDKTYTAHKIEAGMKVAVRDTILNQWIEDKLLLNKFNLNIRRLNRWWYSVYFAEKDDSRESIMWF